jgi:hypothetical protein
MRPWNARPAAGWPRACIALLAGVLFSRGGAAQAQTASSSALPVALEVVTTDECTAGQFRAALVGRVRRPLDLRDDAATKLRLLVTSEGRGMLAGDATFEGASGRAQRSVRGSCDEVSAALALVAATWLEAEPSSEAPAERAAPSPESAPDAPVAPAPSVATPVAIEPATVGPDRTSARVPAPDAAAPPRPFAVGGHGVANVGVVGGPAAGAAIAFAYERGRLELRGAVRGALASETLVSSTAHYAWLTAPLDGCAHALSSRVVRLAACARVEPGYLHVEFADLGHSLPWLALGAGGRIGWAAGPLRLEIEAFAALPVTGYRVTRTGTTLVPLRAVAGGFAAGFMVPFS